VLPEALCRHVQHNQKGNLHSPQVCTRPLHRTWQAMPGGGDMFVEMEKVVVVNEAHAIPGALASGRYVKVTVTDTGTGMDAQTKERIFELASKKRDI